jgi:hypothetical protein
VSDPLAVLPLDKAKLHLNIPPTSTTNDVELEEDFIPPAAERVERHLGRELVPDAMSGSERLAVKVVLAEYWRTQRVSTGRGGFGGGGASGAALEADSDPAGAAPLRRRLVDLLGPGADDVGSGSGAGPVGSFPPAESWPDPAVVRRGWWQW